MKTDKENNSSEIENATEEKFTLNERVVWDSHFGYEIGYFLGEGNSYNTYLVDIRTGIVREPNSYSKNEVHKYTDELITELTKKYKVEKRFSDIF